MDISRKLNCKAQLFNPTGQTESSDQTYTDASTISCFIWGSSKRIISKSEQEITLDFKVLVGPNVPVAINGLLKMAYDPIGNLLFEEGRIVSIQPIAHYRKGLMAQELGVVRW